MVAKVAGDVKTIGEWRSRAVFLAKCRIPQHRPVDHGEAQFTMRMCNHIEPNIEIFEQQSTAYW